MKIYKINAKLNNVPKIKEKLSLCLGYFDGVHIAHQRLINEAKIKSDNYIGVITFDENVKGRDNLTSLISRLNLFRMLDIDYVFIFPFNQEFKKLTHEQFKSRFLDKLKIEALFMGQDFAFGNNRKGNVNYLKKYFNVKVIKFLKKNNKKISSYDIANFIKEGKIEEANKYLGRPYQIRGKVMTGYQKGRDLKFPTANVKILDDYVVPKYGVYKVIVYVLGVPHIAIANVGVHPTINKLKTPIIEAHLLNFNGDLYNKEIYIEFIKFIRPEKKFNSEKELIEQINKDLKIVSQ